MTIIDNSPLPPDNPDVVLLADPVVHVERQQLGGLALVLIRLSWPGGEQPDVVIPLTVSTARLVAAALIDCAGSVDVETSN